MAVDVKKAIQNLMAFGCEAGYESPGMFIVIVPSDSEEEVTKVIPVSVHELEWLAGAKDAAAFKMRLSAVCITDLSKINSAITCDYVTLRA
jgi:hypothetical protein